MNWSKFIKNLKTQLFIASGVLTMCTACEDSFIYESEGDCSVHYRLIFTYDMNLKWADAFHNGEAKSVRVYAFDQNNTLVKTYMVDDAEALMKDNFYIDLDDLAPGDYHLVSWCGIDNTNVSEQSFSAPETPGMTLDDLTCRLNWKSNEQYEAYSNTMLQWMFWGEKDITIKDITEMTMEEQIEIAKNYQYFYYTMPLIKDVNHIRVQLMQANNEPIAVDDFDFRIEVRNGVMNYDNALLESPVINYLPWSIEPSTWTTADDTKADGEDEEYTYNGLAVDLTIARMMANQRGQMNLIVTKKDDNTVSFKIPLIDYALQTLSYFNNAYGKNMTSQEYLDRRDEYELNLILGDDMRWMDIQLDILSWRIVHNDVELH